MVTTRNEIELFRVESVEFRVRVERWGPCLNVLGGAFLGEAKALQSM